MSPQEEVRHREAIEFLGSLNAQRCLPLPYFEQRPAAANIAVKRLGDILDMPQEPHALVPSRENAE